MTRLLRWVAVWGWLTLAVACGGGTATPERPGARANDPTAARAASPNAPAEADAAAEAESARNRPPAEGTSPPRTSRAEEHTAFAPSVGFRSRQRLDEHYEKHGAEFGAISQAEYLRQAQALRDAPAGGAILEMRRGDGSVARFDRATGAFLAFDVDGIIRTFFKPNDGERYFRRQARRRAGG